MIVLRVLFWSALVGTAVATLGPLDWRPETGLPSQVERFSAYVVLSVLWMLAYWRYRWRGIAALIVIVGVLELGQRLEPGRHGRLRDAEAKIAGILVGALIGAAVGMLGRRNADEACAGRSRASRSLLGARRPDVQPADEDSS